MNQGGYLLKEFGHEVIMSPRMSFFSNKTGLNDKAVIILKFKFIITND